MKIYNTKNSNINIIWIIGGLALIGVIIALFAYQGRTSSQQASISQIYRANDKEKPMLVIEPNNKVKDLGIMKVNEESAAEFILSNIGAKPLVISHLRTSCMCTFGEIIVAGRESPMFNMEMHNSSFAKKWKVELIPGESATAKVIYRPALMPVQGPVERLFLFETNDPLNPSVELTIKIFVES